MDTFTLQHGARYMVHGTLQAPKSGQSGCYHPDAITKFAGWLKAAGFSDVVVASDPEHMPDFAAGTDHAGNPIYTSAPWANLDGSKCWEGESFFNDSSKYHLPPEQTSYCVWATGTWTGTDGAHDLSGAATECDWLVGGIADEHGTFLMPGGAGDGVPPVPPPPSVAWVVCKSVLGLVLGGAAGYAASRAAGSTTTGRVIAGSIGAVAGGVVANL